MQYATRERQRRQRGIPEIPDRSRCCEVYEPCSRVKRYAEQWRARRPICARPSHPLRVGGSRSVSRFGPRERACAYGWRAHRDRCSLASRPRDYSRRTMFSVVSPTSDRESRAPIPATLRSRLMRAVASTHMLAMSACALMLPKSARLAHVPASPRPTNGMTNGNLNRAAATKASQ
jgi:hypothetical protein